jgi:hypothetical protein
MNTIHAARVESLLLKYLFNASLHALAYILPAHIEDPPTKCQKLALGLCIHTIPPLYFP